ncbi:MAG: hypothetical protein QGF48_06660, partial [Qipengyuania citrea]|nr:hypothetical protein [Qipengyuania citrea]
LPTGAVQSLAEAEATPSPPVVEHPATANAAAQASKVYFFMEPPMQSGRSIAAPARAVNCVLSALSSSSQIGTG